MSTDSSRAKLEFKAYISHVNVLVSDRFLIGIPSTLMVKFVASRIRRTLSRFKNIGVIKPVMTPRLPI